MMTTYVDINVISWIWKAWVYKYENLCKWVISYSIKWKKLISNYLKNSNEMKKSTRRYIIGMKVLCT